MTQEIMGFWDAVASVGPYANNLHLAPDRITTPTPHNLIFTGQMLFLTPNQQCQSTELKVKKNNNNSKFIQRQYSVWDRNLRR